MEKEEKERLKEKLEDCEHKELKRIVEKVN